MTAAEMLPVATSAHRAARCGLHAYVNRRTHCRFCAMVAERYADAKPRRRRATTGGQSRAEILGAVRKREARVLEIVRARGEAWPSLVAVLAECGDQAARGTLRALEANGQLTSRLDHDGFARRRLYRLARSS